MTAELFESPKGTTPFIRCSCRTKNVDGKIKKAPPIEQPIVILRPGIDPKFNVGHCGKCKKTHARKK